MSGFYGRSRKNQSPTGRLSQSTPEIQYLKPSAVGKSTVLCGDAPAMARALAKTLADHPGVEIEFLEPSILNADLANIERRMLAQMCVTTGTSAQELTVNWKGAGEALRSYMEAEGIPAPGKRRK